MGVQEWHVDNDVVASCTWFCLWDNLWAHLMQQITTNAAAIRKVGQLVNYAIWRGPTLIGRLHRIRVRMDTA